jgi:hypothetical protein
MEEDPAPSTRSLKGLLEWATTPPQAYLMYVICLLLVFGMSFLAGSLRPKKTAGMATPPISAPRN